MTDSIHTLQEFMFRTKGIIYLLAGAYLVGFLAYWKFLQGGKEDDDS